MVKYEHLVFMESTRYSCQILIKFLFFWQQNCNPLQAEVELTIIKPAGLMYFISNLRELFSFYTSTKNYSKSFGWIVSSDYQLRHVCQSVRLSAWNNSVLDGRIFMKYGIRVLF